MPEPRRPVLTLPPKTEQQFMAEVVAYAKLRHWRVFHPRWSMQSAAGWPDLCLTRGGRLLFWECKRDGKEPTAAQAGWLRDLADCPGVEVACVHPADWPAIAACLR